MDRAETSKKTGNPDNDGKLKEQIRRYMTEGKNKLMSLESRITGDPKVKKLLEGTRGMKDKFQKAKRNLENVGRRTEHYIEENPKKAVALAVAAGVLVGTLWSALSGKKGPASKRK